MDPLKESNRVAIVYGTTPGVGGLGHSVAAGITAAAKNAREAFALGPKRAPQPWALPGGEPEVTWIESPPGMPAWMTRYTWLRWRGGRVTYIRDGQLGRWAAQELEQIRPDACYLFTQVALESLRWCRKHGVASVLDNPNGHIRGFQRICERESLRWCGSKFHGHPIEAMVERVEEEYELADRIRVYSDWGKASMMKFGVAEAKIHILRQTVNLERFCPPSLRPRSDGPLRVCYVGSMDLRKGFVYLLEALKLLKGTEIEVRFVGATGDRACAQLLSRDSAGLPVQVLPGDALPVYQQSELLVIPTLEDGLPFVLVEGLACGLPMIVTSEAGASECVRHRKTGWVIPAGDAEKLAAALQEAVERRAELWDMGQQARRDAERYCGPAQLCQLSDWFHREASVIAG